MHNLIGISGKKRSGKDTVSKLLIDILDDNYEIKHFASKLKRIASILTGRSYEFFLDDSNKTLYLDDWGMNVREFLQKLGTDSLRDNFVSDIWIKSLFSEYIGHKNWIISDVRFKDELDVIRNRGGIIIRVDAAYEGYEIPTDQHQSEIDLDDSYDKFDYIINNDSDMECLINKVNLMVKSW